MSATVSSSRGTPHTDRGLNMRSSMETHITGE